MTALTTTITTTDDNAAHSKQRVGESRSVYAIVTERILAALAAGTVPWRKPWQAAAANYVTKREYRGINAFLLGLAPYASRYWLTLRQANKLGATIRKGEQSSIVVFWKWVQRKDSDDQNDTIPVLRYYRVFNVMQCEGLVLSEAPQHFVVLNAAKSAGRVVEEMKDPPRVRIGGNAAYYTRELDTVTVPNPHTFEQPERFASTLFHELTHATGHAKRLNRPDLIDAKHFGDQCYSREELVAEMGAAFLAAHTGIAHVTEPASAAYLAGWLKVLRADHRLVVTAAAQAQRAADYILGRTFDDADEEE